MNILTSSKADEFLFSLDLIRDSPMNPVEQLDTLSKLFYRLVKSITNEEKILYRNFYARFQYLLSRLPLPDKGRRNLDAFRRFVKDEHIKRANSLSIQHGINLLKDLVVIASGRTLTEANAIAAGYFSQLFPQRDYSALTSLKLLCSSWTGIQQLNGRNYFILKGLDLLSMQGEIEIYMWQLDRYDYTVIHPLLTQNTILGLQHIRFRENKGNSYETTFDSLVALEPDFLVEATSVAECFSGRSSNSDIFILSRLMTDLPGAAALKGSMVGYFLDQMVCREMDSREEIYTSAQRHYAMRAARLGRAAMGEIHSSINRDHLGNIATLVEREKAKDLWIEPTYFSVEFGLQGRLDLLSMDGATGTKDIIEVKSGSPPNPAVSIAWRNHYIQVVCYDMMLQSTYGNDRRGSAGVYYSSCTISPYRNIVSKHEEKREALGIRNQLVAKIYQMAANDFSLLQHIMIAGISGLPPFQTNMMQEFQQLYIPGRITAIYYEEMIAFILRELINAKVGDQLKEEEEDQPNGFAGLWLDSLQEKVQDFRVIYDLEVANIDTENGDILLYLTREIAHSFRKGDLVILYPKTGDRYDALSQHILKGSLKEIHIDRLVVSLNNKQTDYGFIVSYDLWAIEPDIFERNYWSGISCLFSLLRATDRKKRLLFGHEKPLFSTGPPYTNGALTSNQAKVVQQALHAQDYYLLQGPPGTGKTSTFLLNYIRESLRMTKYHIVVLAFTNRAVDKICQAFREPREGDAVNYLRMGNRHVTDESLFSELLIDDNPDSWREIINSHRVFVSTVATFQNNYMLLREFIPFSQVVIDEASQLTEAVTAGILALFNKFILIGDYKQLPAVITQDGEMCLTKNNYLRQLGIEDLRISLFERLIRTAKKKGWEQPYGKLRDHYRMHVDIAALISRHYENELMAGTPGQQNTNPPYVLPEIHPCYPLTRHRVMFIEIPKDTDFKRNEREARLAAHIANCLVEEGGVPLEKIGIITTFRAQVAAIKHYLQEELLLDERFIVDTVERYQGDERDIIIFSTVITNAWQLPSIQSIHNDEQGDTDRKLLVSISRAGKQLIILGNAATLNDSRPYKDLLGRIPHFMYEDGIMKKM